MLLAVAVNSLQALGLRIHSANDVSISSSSSLISSTSSSGSVMSQHGLVVGAVEWELFALLVLMLWSSHLELVQEDC